jgi:Ni,Fe-hydrogenase I small subunit
MGAAQVLRALETNPRLPVVWLHFQECTCCSENHYWDNGHFYRHLASFPGFGIETTADTVGLVLGAATAAGIAAHAISTNIRKHHKDAADAKQRLNRLNPGKENNNGKPDRN